MDNIPSQFPSFPNIKGDMVQMIDVVDSMEALRSHHNISTTDALGFDLFGGHSFRLGGAVLLTMLAVELSGVQLMGRWGSDAVKKQGVRWPVPVGQHRPAGG